MKQVTQTRTGRHGNCNQAALASLLELDIEEVPDFCNDDADAWYHQMQVWLIDRGKMDVVYEAAADGGIDWVVQSLIDTGAYYLTSGPNPDGITHVVICQKGKMVWDPNPKRRGITKIEYFFFLFDLPERGAEP